MFIASKENGVENMYREVIQQLLLIFKGIAGVGIIAWNIVRIVQMRHCWIRKKPCEKSQCKWWNFCDKHGDTLTVDLYRMKEIEKNILRTLKLRDSKK